MLIDSSAHHTSIAGFGFVGSRGKDCTAALPCVGNAHRALVEKLVETAAVDRARGQVRSPGRIGVSRPPLTSRRLPPTQAKGRRSTVLESGRRATPSGEETAHLSSLIPHIFPKDDRLRHRRARFAFSWIRFAGELEAWVHLHLAKLLPSLASQWRWPSIPASSLLR